MKSIIPCIYYGSEWGARARKEEGDPALRACFEVPQWTNLCELIAKLSVIKKQSEALNFGSFRSVLLTNKQCVFERKTDKERVLIAINADGHDFYGCFDAGSGSGEEFLTGQKVEFNGGMLFPAYSINFIKV